MRFSLALTALAIAPAIAAPHVYDTQLVERDAAPAPQDNGFSFVADVSDLWKRKGGGGGGGKGGGSSSSSSGKGGGTTSSGSTSSGYVPFSPDRSGSGSGSGSGRGYERGVESGGVGSSTSRPLWPSRSGPATEQKLEKHVVEDVGEVDSLSTAKRSAGAIVAIMAISSMGRGGGGGHRGGSHSSSNKHSSSSAGRGSTSSNAGGSTKTGSGAPASYGGFYGGGARTPYTSGGKSPSGISPLVLGAGLGLGAGVLAYGLWPHGAYIYPYTHPYTFRNASARSNSTATSTSSSATATPTAAKRSINVYARQDSGVEQTKPVSCLCGTYDVCGCDDNSNTTFLDSVIGDGTNLNASLVSVADINGTSTILINGTLPNGTSASGGTENANGAARMLGNLGGYWVMVVLACATAFVI
ncbi:hypothetical protein LSUE1_G005017 [Lachnellula suecica]|uniref:DUF7732 domain-containing protein n=1 Tax=Lachnellula suecica TaxID=602035 RepID=A0A8T9C7E3_9HELO|nr:hypothetical protein LSUE1_G005017 [Lachnellula suecica]